jgi:hypothetical protein
MLERFIVTLVAAMLLFIGASCLLRPQAVRDHALKSHLRGMIHLNDLEKTEWLRKSTPSLLLVRAVGLLFIGVFSLLIYAMLRGND